MNNAIDPETETEQPPAEGGETSPPPPEEGEPSSPPVETTAATSGSGRSGAGAECPPAGESPLNPDGVDSGRPVDQTDEALEHEAEEQARLQALNSMFQPTLRALIETMVDAMGIHGMVALGATIGRIMAPYAEHLKQANMRNAPRHIADWLNAVGAMAEYTKFVQKQQQGKIIVPE